MPGVPRDCDFRLELLLVPDVETYTPNGQTKWEMSGEIFFRSLLPAMQKAPSFWTLDNIVPEGSGITEADGACKWSRRKWEIREFAREPPEQSSWSGEIELISEDMAVLSTFPDLNELTKRNIY